MPKSLVIETAAACSVTLIEVGILLAERHETVGRGHAERLVPMIAELPGGDTDRIMVDCGGPGSFTGIHVGLAATRGLALGWNARIAGFFLFHHPRRLPPIRRSTILPCCSKADMVKCSCRTSPVRFARPAPSLR